MDWISVEDRLPENNGYYLWFTYDSEISVEYYYDGHIPLHATHWMPLPEPPEREK